MKSCPTLLALSLLVTVATPCVARSPLKVYYAGGRTPRVYRSPSERAWMDAMVFLGHVEAVGDTVTSTQEHRRFARVRMLSLWKGDPSRRPLLMDAQFPYPKAGEFVPGVTYVITAGYERGRTRIREVHSAVPFSEASKDLADLGTPTIVQRLPGRKLHPSR